MCNYVISVLVFSWIANIAVGVFNCFVCNFCGIGDWMDALVSVCIAIYWAVACGVVGVGVGKADGEDVPQSYWRHTTLALMWVTFLIHLIQALTSVGRNSMK